MWITLIEILKNTTQIISKILIVFDDMIADIISNKKLNPIVTELLLRGKKLNISIAFITQSHFSVPKNIRQFQLHLIIHQMFNLKTLSTFPKIVLQNYILF